MKKRVYVTPRTECVRVIVEGTFATSVVNNTDDDVKTTGHQLYEINGDEFTGEGGWNNGTWE